jgi:hypothetical protein
MTAPAPTPPAGPSGSGLAAAVGSPRALAAWALVGYVALFQFFEFAQWILPNGGTFTSRSENGSFRSLVVMAMPVLAVVLATFVAPSLRAARLLTIIALVEYAVSLFFGLVTLLIGLGGILDRVDNAKKGFNAFDYLVLGIASLVLIAAAAYVVVRALRPPPNPHP